ncbi:MAG: NADP-dependent malic enzyme [Candidatus Aenigmarchaeota archaeon]|nr:NADP-dependent malic enzyme [Candidatus Aenigmarchaeota archaeon]
MSVEIRKMPLEFHRQHAGKVAIASKVPLKDRSDLSKAYTPGVAEVSKEIFADKKKVYEYTMKANSVAVVTDGSAVLGLGNIGPEAALPVMEGKAILFKEFADIDAFPICLNTQDENKIIETVKNIAPAFGGINLEDISAPRCFYVEEQLQDLGIPVMHDDQHGTAIVVAAALMNAAKVLGKNIEELRVVINGAGAAGTAIAKILSCLGYDRKVCNPVKEIIICDSAGIIHKGRTDMNKYKAELGRITNRQNRTGTLADALEGADAFIGVSKGNLLKKEMIQNMAGNPIVFAMANPVPEIMPAEAAEAGAAIVGSGRSDFPNQINNSLGFPGVFRGALDAKATRINNEMKLAAAYALSGTIKPTKDEILPSMFDKNVVKNVSAAVAKAAIETGVVRE